MSMVTDKEQTSRPVQGVKSVRLILPKDASPVMQNSGKILTQQVEQRCETKVQNSGDAAYVVEFALAEGVGVEGFRIEDRQGGGVRIVGNDERGVLFGIGKFLRTSRYDQGGFTPGTWRGTSVPKCPARMAYLATHFLNFYEAAPIEEVHQYIEDLGLWGYNTILIHFPTWQFNGLSDPAARQWMDRFKVVISRARQNGLQVGLLQIPGEGYKNAPKEYRQSKPVTGHHRGNFGVNLCVSKPEVRAHLREIHEAFLDEFKDTGLDYFCFWPYDEGGCGCPDCWPWGAKGFLNISKELMPLIRARFPNIKIILSTWCFENENDKNPDGEWDGLARSLEQDNSWVNYIMADGHDNYFPKYLLENKVPGGLGLINFPEISMFGMWPWGGYGANPAPAHFEKLWGRIKHLAAGGAPYSEGIYEDLNKIICGQFYWDPERKANETVREYAAFEFGPAYAEEVVEMVGIFEANHQRGKIGQSALRAFEIAKKIDAGLSVQAKTAWRWRLMYLRALIDKEIFERNGKKEGEALKAAFDEITRISHVERANPRVKPLQIK